MDAEAEREFRAFVTARGPALLRTAFLLTGDQGRAEDLVQSTLATVAARWRRIRQSPEAYARRVLYHEQVSWWRRRGPGREEPTDRLPEPAAPDLTGQADLRVALRAALAALPARQRAVVVLRYLEDLPERAVADLLGCSVGTVRSHGSRGLARLRTVAGLGDLIGEETR